jgi:hypothetical protein
MPRIKLAGWYGDKPPGSELDVDEVQLKALRRDGRVAGVVEDTTPEEPVAASEQRQTAEAADESPAGRRKR